MTEKEREQAKVALARAVDYKSCFGTEAGKRVLLDLIRNHHMKSSTFDPANLYQTVFSEGERNVVLRIMAKLNIDAQKLEQIITKGKISDASRQPST